jgi:hypothetical protein
VATTPKGAVISCAANIESSRRARLANALTEWTCRSPDDTTLVKQQDHLQNLTEAVDETNRAECTWQQQDSSPALGTIVLFRPDHMTRLAFVVSLLIHRSLDRVRATSPTVVARELLPGSPLVLARIRQVSDHHTGVFC